jgi:hypothetical protein
MLGAALPVGAFRNCFGGGVYMLRSTALLLPPSDQNPTAAAAGGGKSETSASGESGSVYTGKNGRVISVGGWSGNLAEGYDHWEWLSRAALAGARVELFPEGLAWSPPVPGASRTARRDPAAAAAGPGRYCSPRHRHAFEPLFHELSWLGLDRS